MFQLDVSTILQGTIFRCILCLGESPDESTNFKRLYPTFVEVPLLWLMHIGKCEVLALIDLMEDEWDRLMIFRPSSLWSRRRGGSIRRSPTAVWCKGSHASDACQKATG